jgi:simple sugar transport system permease protein
MNTFVNSAVVFATPVLIAAIAGLIAERTGVLNIGLEGFMLFGAFVAAWIAGDHGSVALGLLGAMFMGLVFGALYGLVVIHLRGDQIAVGIAFNLLALGLTGYGLSLLTADAGDSALTTKALATLAIPGLSSIPWIGPVFDQPWLAYVGYVLVPVTFLVLFRSGLGIRARACGEYSDGAIAVGIDVKRWRLLAMMISGLIAAIAGAYLVLGDTQTFAEGMSAGKGYIALAVIILGRWNPLGAVWAALLFGAAQALNFQFQTGSVLGLDLPVTLVQTLPYIVTIVAVTIVGRRIVAPAEDGRPLQA